jgi:hypothetical protein
MADLGGATYSLFGDTFALANGSATIQGHSGLSDAPTDTLIPVGYTLAATSTASGDLNGDGVPDEVAALYRGFGANLNWVTLFAFSDQNGALTQIASGVAYQGDSKVESVSVSGGVVTLNLLVVSQEDLQNLAHYQQVPNTPLALQFTVQDGTFVPVPSATTAAASSTTAAAASAAAL